MKRKRAMLVITVDLDPLPGAHHTIESARDGINVILQRTMSHYNPKVEIAGELLEEGP